MPLRVGHQHSRFLSILARFVDYYSSFWGPGVISTIANPGMRLRVGYQLSKFWPILTRFVDNYSPAWCPEATSIVVEPQGALMCRLSTLAVLADSGPFRWLLLTVLGSKVISKIDEPRGAFTCRSSTLVVLADYGMFCGLLVTVLGSQSDQDLRTQGCVYVSFINTSGFCRF